MTLQQMLFGWAVVTGAMIVAFLGLLMLACLLAGLTPKRPPYFPLPEQPWVWSEEVWTPEDAEAFYPLIDQLADEGEYELWKDKDIGKTYPLPHEWRDVA